MSQSINTNYLHVHISEPNSYMYVAQLAFDFYQIERLEMKKSENENVLSGKKWFRADGFIDYSFSLPPEIMNIGIHKFRVWTKAD